MAGLPDLQIDSAQFSKTARADATTLSFSLVAGRNYHDGHEGHDGQLGGADASPQKGLS
jgi:hypothetical protein